MDRVCLGPRTCPQIGGRAGPGGGGGGAGARGADRARSVARVSLLKQVTGKLAVDTAVFSSADAACSLVVVVVVVMVLFTVFALVGGAIRCRAIHAVGDHARRVDAEGVRVRVRVVAWPWVACQCAFTTCYHIDRCVNEERKDGRRGYLRGETRGKTRGDEERRSREELPRCGR